MNRSTSSDLVLIEHEHAVCEHTLQLSTLVKCEVIKDVNVQMSSGTLSTVKQNARS